MSRFFSGRIVYLLLVCLIATLILPAAFAQETTAGIQGTVKDQSGAVVAKATVEVTSSALIGSQKATTDSGGNFRINALPPGTYTLTVNAQGFRTYKQTNVDLQAGRLPSLEIALTVGGATETVEVTSEAPIVDVTQSKVSVTMDQQVLDNLPKGRSFQTLIPFAPGARQEPLQSARGSRDSGFQIDGASDSENVYMVDGMNITNIQNGGASVNGQTNRMATDFVQEVNIKSSSFEAEFGGALGGVVNAVPKRGSNAWHGEFLTYIRTNALNANDPCTTGGNVSTSTVCFVRANPTSPLNTGLTVDKNGTPPRTDQTAENYIPKKDQRRIYEPGFEIGGPLWKDRLWLFAGYIPTLDSLHRTVNFTGANPGIRTFAQTFTQHNGYTRLDYRAMNSLRLFAGWTYGYSRTTGALPTPDSAWGQLNTGAGTDPNTIRADNGTVNPNSLYNFGADWTPTSKLVISARYGYMFNNTEDRGTTVGTRYIYQNNATATTPTLSGAALPTVAIHGSGFANIGSNFQTLFDAYKRRSLNIDGSYFVGHLLGTHTFKGGFYRMSQMNDVLGTFNTSQVLLWYNDVYQPVTSSTACDSIISANRSAYGAAGAQCRGNAGYFIIRDGVDNFGAARGLAQALYAQDAWTVGHGLTLNLGIRFDKEFVPPYRAGFRSVDFGYGDKIAPRIGGAYDLLHNGKVKLYASYGKFFDIMKLGLPRGSFGSDYWHDCVYAMDNPDYTNYVPVPVGGHSCPATGQPGGITSGARFIENVDFRATKDSSVDPPLDPHIKPMSQHEFVTGVDWAITPNYSLETRYSRKRLDQAIEDMSVTDNLGFYIGNPGSAYADLLHRGLQLNGSSAPLSPALCPECPGVTGPHRRYDGLEFRLTRKPTARWFGSVSYTYSKLAGNYAGLTNTDVTDGNGGRHSPNNGRAFDIPTMIWDTNGKLDDGPLGTDRPHTAKIFGYYRIPWLGQETLLGFQQAAYQGTPLSTCIPVVGTSSACEFMARGDFARIHKDTPTGNFVLDSIDHGARTSPYFQTDFSFQHQIKTSKAHENQRLVFEANILNLLNQHVATAYYENLYQGSGLITLKRTPRFTGDPGYDWNAMERGFDVIAASNATGAYAGNTVGGPLTLFGRYGHPQAWQLARNIRLAVRFTF